MPTIPNPPLVTVSYTVAINSKIKVTTQEVSADVNFFNFTLLVYLLKQVISSYVLVTDI